MEAAEEEEGCPKMGQYNMERGGTELVYMDFSGTYFVVEVYIKFLYKITFRINWSHDECGPYNFGRSRTVEIKR